MGGDLGGRALGGLAFGTVMSLEKQHREETASIGGVTLVDHQH